MEQPAPTLSIDRKAFNFMNIDHSKMLNIMNIDHSKMLSIMKASQSKMLKFGFNATKIAFNTACNTLVGGMTSIGWQNPEIDGLKKRMEEMERILADVRMRQLGTDAARKRGTFDRLAEKQTFLAEDENFTVTTPEPLMRTECMEKYRTMMKNRLPQGAVRQRMLMDGLEDAAIKRFFSNSAAGDRRAQPEQARNPKAPKFSATDLKAVTLRPRMQTRAALKKAEAKVGVSIAEAAAAAARAKSRCSEPGISSSGAIASKGRGSSKRKRRTFGPPCLSDIRAVAKRLRTTKKATTNKKSRASHGILNSTNTKDFIENALKQKFHQALPSPATPSTPW